MGASRRPRPRYLAAKLKRIRTHLNLSQAGMVERLDFDLSFLHTSHISEFERDIREPSLPLLLKYARIAKVNVEYLIDDEMDLPNDF